MTDTIPSGFRSVWERRGDIATAGLFSKLNSDTWPADYPRIPLEDNGASDDADCIKVHIFGTFSKAAIEAVSGPRPRSKMDRLIWRKFKKSTAKTGIKVKEI